MSDGSGSEESSDEEFSEPWREFERVDEQYREPAETDPFDVEPEIPEAPDPSENEVDPFLLRRFWALVVVFNAATLATALGFMFAFFEGNYTLGGQLLVAGLAGFGFGFYRFRTTKERLDERSDGNGRP